MERLTKIRRLCIFLQAGLLAGLAGCTQAPPALVPVPPPPAVIVVELSSSVFHLEDEIQHCAGQQDNLVLFIQPAELRLDLPSGTDLSIGLLYPSPAPAFAAPLYMEEVVVVVHPTNPVRKLDADQIRLLFEGRVRQWRELGGSPLPVEVWTYPPLHETREVFEQALWSSPPVNALAYLAPGPAQMAAAVAEDPARVGYLPRNWLTEQVEGIELTGENAELLRQPVLALARERPGPQVTALVACLQRGEYKE
jgi:hypothetical protein